MSDLVNASPGQRAKRDEWVRLVIWAVGWALFWLALLG